MGGRSDSPHKGLLDAGLVTKVKDEGNEEQPAHIVSTRAGAGGSIAFVMRCRVAKGAI